MKVILHDLKKDMPKGIEERADKVIFADGKYAPLSGLFQMLDQTFGHLCYD